MPEVSEVPAVRQFPRHVNAAKPAIKPDHSLLEKTHAEGSINGPHSLTFEPNSTKGVCPCCGGELKNQRPRIDLNTNSFIFKTRVVALRPREAEVLEVLIKRSPGVVTRDTITRCLWGWNEPNDPFKNIQVHICRLRHVLKGTGATILNVWDVGYRFSVEECTL